MKVQAHKKNIKTTHVWSNKKKRSFLLLLLHLFSFLPAPTAQGRRLGRFPDGCARRRADQRRQRGAGAVAGAFVAIQRAEEVLVMLQAFTQLTLAVFLVAGAMCPS